MIKYIMMIKICSALYGECMPEFKHKIVFDNWYDCAQYGLTETKSLMTEIGPEVVNRDKVTVSFEPYLYRCVNCGYDLEQKVNGVIKYVVANEETRFKKSSILDDGQETS